MKSFFKRKKKKIQDGNNQAANNNPSAQNAFTTQVEQLNEEEIPLQGPPEPLGLTAGVNPSEDGSCCSVESESDLSQQKQRDVRLIQASVSQHLPKPPSDLDQDLQQHLVNVQETVRNELMRLSPDLEKMGLIGYLIDCYHRQTFGHINDLLEKVQSCQKSFQLMNWVLHTYLSLEVLNHHKNASKEKGDFLLLTDLVAKANNLLLKNVQKEVKKLLDEILLTDRNQDVLHSEESCVGLYIDVIKMIDSRTEEAQKISSKLSHDVREICYQELKMFLGKYTSEQTKILRKKAVKAIPNKIHYFKTLKTCKEIKKYVQTKNDGVTDSLLKEIVEMLEKMENVSLKLLMEIVADKAKRLLQKYFKTKYKQSVLMSGLKTHLPELLEWCKDEHTRVMDEAYKLIALTYLKHLVRSSQKKLRKFWSSDVGPTVTEDAQSLHNTMSNLAPGVQQWNLMLLKIPELLDCNDINAMKLIVSSMKCPTWSEDEEFLSALLEWKGLCKQEVKEVLDALPGRKPANRSVFYHIWSVYRKLRRCLCNL